MSGLFFGLLLYGVVAQLARAPVSQSGGWGIIRPRFHIFVGACTKAGERVLHTCWEISIIFAYTNI